MPKDPAPWIELFSKVEAPAVVLSLSDAELLLIGKCIAAWNEMEVLMVNCVLFALELDLAGVKIMSGYNIAPKADILESVVAEKLRVFPLINQIAHECASKIKSLSNFRNDIAHGIWEFDEKTQKLAGSKQLWAAKTITIDQVPAKYLELCKLTHLLTMLSFAILKALNPGGVDPKLDELLYKGQLAALLYKSPPRPRPDPSS